MKSNCTVRVEVILNNETYLALTIHFQMQNKGVMPTIWFVYGTNYVQNSILNRLRGAWSVCGKTSTNLDKPNFSQLILIIGSLK